jgi:hypothetical protein
MYDVLQYSILLEFYSKRNLERANPFFPFERKSLLTLIDSFVNIDLILNNPVNNLNYLNIICLVHRSYNV